ncbi:MAG: 2Fe-2S iron-sulfur cluster binding domain-containing protein [Thermoflavifilum sp.]|nr:2Fe-2S iron-sulfur cluster binding domain-containing protein [Thermoflavifilum sp.]MCL6513754.1 2Fe-2S iron-sulfur cluster binding domain-containing protein [Alicyclobacillus sp.]
MRVKVPPGGFLWDAAAASGVTLPHVCLQGWCLTCAARLVAGRVDMSAARRYYPADEAAGFILPCTAVPVTDVVVVTHQRDAMIQHRRQHRLPAPSGGKPR